MKSRIKRWKPERLHSTASFNFSRFTRPPKRTIRKSFIDELTEAYDLLKARTRGAKDKTPRKKRASSDSSETVLSIRGERLGPETTKLAGQLRAGDHYQEESGSWVRINRAMRDPKNRSRIHYRHDFGYSSLGDRIPIKIRRGK